MDFNAITGAIQNFGFAIVMCGAMGWYIYYSDKNHRHEIEKLNNQHKEEMSGMVQAVQNNTVALEKLCVLMERKENENKSGWD